jgi:hypothetical protein
MERGWIVLAGKSKSAVHQWAVFNAVLKPRKGNLIFFKMSVSQLQERVDCSDIEMKFQLLRNAMLEEHVNGGSVSRLYNVQHMDLNHLFQLTR